MRRRLEPTADCTGRIAGSLCRLARLCGSFSLAQRSDDLTAALENSSAALVSACSLLVGIGGYLVRSGSLGMRCPSATSRGSGANDGVRFIARGEVRGRGLFSDLLGYATSGCIAPLTRLRGAQPQLDLRPPVLTRTNFHVSASPVIFPQRRASGKGRDSPSGLRAALWRRSLCCCKRPALKKWARAASRTRDVGALRFRLGLKCPGMRRTR